MVILTSFSSITFLITGSAFFTWETSKGINWCAQAINLLISSQENWSFLSKSESTKNVGNEFIVLSPFASLTKSKILALI